VGVDESLFAPTGPISKWKATVDLGVWGATEQKAGLRPNRYSSSDAFALRPSSGRWWSGGNETPISAQGPVIFSWGFAGANQSERGIAWGRR